MIKKASIYFLLVLLTSCAIRVDPSGGEKDILPPKVLKTVPENYSINTKPTDIVLTFDEFVQLKDISTQLVVSPLLKYPPESKIKKKSVHIHFLDTLEENTTYTLNFGNSIIDNNEGNPLENYQFVFSTGNVVDSLKISGKIEYAFDHKKEKNLLAMIYKGNDDSLPFKQRPNYFAKTNDNGEFTINNIAPGNYKLIALEDKDGNYLYTNGEENIGYADSRVEAGDEKVQVRLFKEPPPLHLNKSVSLSPGKVLLVFSAAADTVKLNFLSDTTKLEIFSKEFSDQKDSLTILYKNTEVDSLSFYYFGGKKMDTVDVRLFKQNSQVTGRGKFALLFEPADKTSEHHFYLPYKVMSNHPLVSLNESAFVLKRDTVVVSDYKTFFTDSIKSSFLIDAKWVEKSEYELFIPPGTATDIYGLKNDTTILEWTVRPETYYGTMMLKLSAIKANVIVQLLDDNDFVVRQSYVKGDTAIQYSYLDPKLYRVKLIDDANGNNMWDSGNLMKKIQPESTNYYPEKITVRSNWDVDVKWDFTIKPETEK
ncbi:MAG: Ig-like domain-containing protein [Bacteroidetes bacterium]|nr:Ig-like domain-containing protein [Bacteroidota bacterium]